LITSSGAYTQVLVDALEECGMTPETFEELVKAVAAASPTSLNAPSEFDFTSSWATHCSRASSSNVAANTYEVVATVAGFLVKPNTVKCEGIEMSPGDTCRKTRAG
jgi:hypothetical protein